MTYQSISFLGFDPLPNLEHLRLDTTSVEELNYLAQRLDSLSDEQFIIYQALFDQRFGDVDSNELLSVKDLINMTYGLDSVMVASNIHNDEQLVLVGDTAGDRRDGIVDGLDDELGVCRLGHLDGRLAECIAGHLVVCDQNAIDVQRALPRNGNLSMKQTVVDTEQLDHRSPLSNLTARFARSIAKTLRPLPRLPAARRPPER